MQTLQANLPDPPSAEPPVPNDIFTAIQDGLYQISVLRPFDEAPWYTVGSGPAWAAVELFLNGHSLSLGTNLAGIGYLPRSGGTIYLAAGDVLSYRGPAAQLALARLGDEATDE